MIAQAKQLEKQIPLLLRLLENALRSGYNVQQSFQLATEELSFLAQEDVKQVVADFKAGKPFQTVLSDWLDHAPSADLDLLVATIRVQMEVGGNLADKLNLLGQILEKRTLN